MLQCLDYDVCLEEWRTFSVLMIYHGDYGPEKGEARPREQLNSLSLSETFERLGNVQTFILWVGIGKVRTP